MEPRHSHTCGSHQFTPLFNRNLIQRQLLRLQFLSAPYYLLQIQPLYDSTNSQGNELAQKITNPLYYRAGSWSGNSMPVSQVSVILGLQAALFKVTSPLWEHFSIHTQGITTSKFQHSHFLPKYIQQFLHSWRTPAEMVKKTAFSTNKTNLKTHMYYSPLLFMWLSILIRRSVWTPE